MKQPKIIQLKSFLSRFWKNNYLNLIGLLFNLLGATVAASGVIMSDVSATHATTLHFDTQIELKNAFLDASNAAIWGLGMIAIGTLIQILALIQSEIRSGSAVLNQ